MTKAIRAAESPFITEVEAGKNYIWCSCGKSKRQPLCDGSHSGTDFTPVIYKATETKKVAFCGCKVSSSQPLCDGSHNK